jgi:hypothetical protein
VPSARTRNQHTAPLSSPLNVAFVLAQPVTVFRFAGVFGSALSWISQRVQVPGLLSFAASAGLQFGFALTLTPHPACFGCAR